MIRSITTLISGVNATIQPVKTWAGDWSFELTSYNGDDEREDVNEIFIQYIKGSDVHKTAEMLVNDRQHHYLDLSNAYLLSLDLLIEPYHHGLYEPRQQILHLIIAERITRMSIEVALHDDLISIKQRK